MRCYTRSTKAGLDVGLEVVSHLDADDGSRWACGLPAVLEEGRRFRRQHWQDHGGRLAQRQVAVLANQSVSGLFEESWPKVVDIVAAEAEAAAAASHGVVLDEGGRRGEVPGP